MALKKKEEVLEIGPLDPSKPVVVRIDNCRFYQGKIRICFPHNRQDMDDDIMITNCEFLGPLIEEE
jgi:hypothetical protein